MLHSIKSRVRTSVRTVLLVASMALLAGCASTLSARVTTYQQWPADAQGQTYRLVSSAAQVNNLEYGSFSDMIRAAMGPTGLVEAAQGARARFNVTFEYGNPVTQVWVQQYNDPYFYGGFAPAFGWGGYYGHGGWGGGGVFFAPPVVNVPVEVYKNTLSVFITDNNHQGKEVYRSSAVSTSSGNNLLSAMPYLTRAVFDGFPGNNGQVRDITYERQR